MATKKTSARFQTPVCELNFNHIVVPDLKYGPTFQTTPTLDEAEGLKMVAAMEALNPAFKGKIPYKVADGKLTMKVKQKRYITWFDKTGKKQEKEVVPTLLNADNSPYTGTENPWGGSTGEVAMTIDLTKDQNGNPTVALRLVGVRIHEVKMGSGGNDDPLFGGGKPKGDEVEDVPQAAQGDDSFDDDIPFDNPYRGLRSLMI